MQNKSQLPRLAPEFYQGRVAVFWTYSIQDREEGWLGEDFHQRFREVLFHTAFRHRFLVPAYCLMPDHLHWLGLGVTKDSDLRLGSEYLRRNLAKDLAPAQWQHQPQDHVLREEEREREAFTSTCHYILENPLRKNLVKDRREWEVSGCVIPGYADIDWRLEDFWMRFWRIYNFEVSGKGVFG
ncbi:MAG: hypothetical protein AAGJ81_11770 [Verrucomicrobiota bacterium]